MTIKEIEARTGMEEDNIRFYESEGLITSQWLENGDRGYLEEDIQILLRIKLLRSLHISLDEIKTLRYGNKALTETLSDQIEILKLENKDVLCVIDVCRMMQEDQVTFEKIDGQKYLDLLEKIGQNVEVEYMKDDEEKVLPVFHPWRRYFARMLDISIYMTIWLSILIFVFHTSMLARGNWWDIFDTFVSIIIMLFVEPLLLHKFATTPGKAIFGIKVEHAKGRKLSYGEGLERTWRVIGAGMGYNIPIYNIVRLWKSYKLCKEKHVQPWNEYCSSMIKDTKWYRGVGIIGANVVIFGLLVIFMMSQQLPPNRGDLAEAAFIENYNYYANYFGLDFGDQYLDENGNWVEKSNGNTTGFDMNVLTFGYTEKPKFIYTTQDGIVTGVSFNVNIENSEEVLNSYDIYMLLAEISFVGAQDEMTLFSKSLEKVALQMPSAPYSDFHFVESGIEFDCQIEYSGYQEPSSSFLILNPNETERYFRLNFNMTKVD